MAEKKPLCNYSGEVKELQSGDTLPSSGSGLPDTFTGTAGEALSQYDVVYANSSDSGELWIASNDGTAVQADAIGIVTESGGIADASTGEVTRLGPITNAGWSWTPGATLWLGADGAMTETMPSAGNYAKPLGYAETATKIWFAPQNGWLVGFDIELSEVPPGHTGRVELVSTTQIEWTGYKYPGWDATKGRDIEIIPSSIPVLNYDDNDIDGNPLTEGSVFDLFLESVSTTSAKLVAKEWSAQTARAVTPALWHGRERYDNTTDTGKKRLFVGTVMMDTGPVFKDDPNVRFIWNKYNQRILDIGVDNPYSSNASDNPASTSWEGWASSDSTWKVEYVVGDAVLVSADAIALAQYSDSKGVQIGIGLDSNSVNSALCAGSSWAQAIISAGTTIVVKFQKYATPGYHYLLPLQARVGASSDRSVVFWSDTFASSEKTASFRGWLMG